MKCKCCGCHIDPKLDWRSLLTVFALTVLIFFIGGLFFYHEFLIPKWDQRIEKDKIIKEELKKGYIPLREKNKTKPELKKKG